MKIVHHVIFVAFLAGSAPAFAGGIPAVSGVLVVNGPGPTLKGLSPTFSLSAADRPAVFAAECEVGGQKVSAQSEVLPAGERFFVALPAKPPVVGATCGVFASFANGLSERREVSLSWSWTDPPPKADPAPKADPPPKADPTPRPDAPPAPDTPAGRTGSSG